MQVSRFQFDMTQPGETPPGETPEVPEREVRRAAPDSEHDDRRIEEPIEEPGYGHGV